MEIKHLVIALNILGCSLLLVFVVGYFIFRRGIRSRKNGIIEIFQQSCRRDSTKFSKEVFASVIAYLDRNNHIPGFLHAVIRIDERMSVLLNEKTNISDDQLCGLLSDCLWGLGQKVRDSNNLSPSFIFAMEIVSEIKEGVRKNFLELKEVKNRINKAAKSPDSFNNYLVNNYTEDQKIFENNASYLGILLARLEEKLEKCSSERLIEN